jgi:meromycolic acid enoyl-[acyl-carrier-protein] reductase
VLLEGKRILVTGLLTDRSIAYAIAREAQLAGAEVILTGYGRLRRVTERAARTLPSPPPILQLDVTRDEDFTTLRAALDRDWGGIDGAVHAIAGSARQLVRDGILGGGRDDARQAFEICAYSYARLAQALAPAMPRGGSLVALSFAPGIAWPGYDWLGVVKAALESINRYLAAALGPRKIRSNVLACGPITSVAAETFERFEVLCDAWEAQAPLGWDADDPTAIGKAACLLLCDHAAAMTGGVLHADGGYHAVARPAADNFASGAPLAGSAVTASTGAQP